MAGKAWADMTPEERLAARIEKWRNPDIPFKSPEAEADYKARVDRILAAINLEKPDRVPVSLLGGFWGAYWAGLTPYDVMSDPARAAQAWTDFNLEFKLDTQVSPLFASVSSSMLEHLDYRTYSWPGHGVAKEASFQYNEKEWMLPEEYDHLISDPSDYLLRTYLPRAVGGFAGFANLSSFWDFIEMPFSSFHMGGWGSPEMTEGLQRLAAASAAASAWAQSMFGMVGDLMMSGLPRLLRGRIESSLRHPGRHHAGHQGRHHGHVPLSGEGVGRLRAARAGRRRLGPSSARVSWAHRSYSCPCTRAPTAS